MSQLTITYLTNTMNIEPQSLTVETVEEIREALYRAYEQSCRTLARVHNYVITPEQASVEIRELLTPLQISPPPMGGVPKANACRNPA